MAVTPPSAERKGSVAVLVPSEVVAQLRMISAHRNLTLGEAIQKYGGQGIDREYRKIASEINRDLGGEG